jgi:hypothetical protein
VLLNRRKILSSLSPSISGNPSALDVCLTMKTFTLTTSSASHVKTVFLSLVSTVLTPWAPQTSSWSHHHHFSSQKRRPLFLTVDFPSFRFPLVLVQPFNSGHSTSTKGFLKKGGFWWWYNGRVVFSFGLVGSDRLASYSVQWSWFMRKYGRVLQLLQIYINYLN